MAEEMNAKRVITMEDIKYNPANKAMAVVSCIPIVGAIIFFVEKNDLFVRYHAAQFGILFVAGFFTWVPFLGWFLGLAIFVAVIVGIIKTLNGERFDIPVVSGLALNLMNSIQ